ncbi:MAG: hypothetical protein ACTS5I_03255 [Rhodanobacter sp.]
MEWGFGYVDFAGSGVVHAVGGAAALAGAIVLGPRIGKFGADGKPRALAAHSSNTRSMGHSGTLPCFRLPARCSSAAARKPRPVTASSRCSG